MWNQYLLHHHKGRCENLSTAPYPAQMSEPHPNTPEYTKYPLVPTTKLDDIRPLLTLLYHEKSIEGVQSRDWVTLPGDLIKQLSDRSHPRAWHLRIPAKGQVPLLWSILQDNGSSATKEHRLPGVSFETSDGRTLVTKKNGKSFHVYIRKCGDGMYEPAVTIANGEGPLTKN